MFPSRLGEDWDTNSEAGSAALPHEDFFRKGPSGTLQANEIKAVGKLRMDPGSAPIQSQSFRGSHFPPSRIVDAHPRGTEVTFAKEP